VRATPAVALRWGFAGLGCRVGVVGLLETARRGTLPRFSGDQAGQVVEGEVEDPLIGCTRRQMDLYLGFQLDDAGGDLDEAQSQGVELHDAPRGALWHHPAQRPQQPISAGVEEETELVGLSFVA